MFFGSHQLKVVEMGGRMPKQENVKPQGSGRRQKLVINRKLKKMQFLPPSKRTGGPTGTKKCFLSDNWSCSQHTCNKQTHLRAGMRKLIGIPLLCWYAVDQHSIRSRMWYCIQHFGFELEFIYGAFYQDVIQHTSTSIQQINKLTLKENTFKRTKEDVIPLWQSCLQYINVLCSCLRCICQLSLTIAHPDWYPCRRLFRSHESNKKWHST